MLVRKFYPGTSLFDILKMHPSIIWQLWEDTIKDLEEEAAEKSLR